MIKQILAKVNHTLYRFSFRFVQIILLVFTGILCLSCVLATCYAADMETQLVLTKWDNPLCTLPVTAVFILLLSAAAVCFGRKSSLSLHRFLRILVYIWCLAAGLVLIVFSKSVPAGDGYSVYEMAQRLAAGDTSVIHPTDSYLSYYPQQIGLVAFWEILIRIWNLIQVDQQAYHFIKIIYLLLECVILYFQEKTIHILWQDEKAECLYLLLAGLCCPLLMYSTFLYSEIPSFAAVSIGIYLLLRLLAAEEHSFALALGTFLSLALSVLLRKNSLIFIIAAVLILLLWGLWKKRPGLLLLAVLCTLGALMVLPMVQKYYENRSGSTLSSGVPAMSYFAMGMQESSRANGWYNGFNFYTYQDTGMDTAATVSLSKEAIRERLSYFREHPKYTAQFYLQKYLSQWVDGTYACRQATLATFGGRSPFFLSLYEGQYSHSLISYCNIYQNILYIGAFLFCLTAIRRRHPEDSTTIASQLPAYLGLIGVLGGFLFHMAWEANARYIFPYALSLLPYTARGLSVLANMLNNTYCRQKSFQNKQFHKSHDINTSATGKQ